jgi:hypothetical protein
MANYLRKRRMQEISTARDEKRAERETKPVKPVGCPYCFSRSLETHGEQQFCRNCHRYL